MASVEAPEKPVKEGGPSVALSKCPGAVSEAPVSKLDANMSLGKSLSSLYTDGIQSLPDERIAGLSDKPWKGSIKFKVFVLEDGDDCAKVYDSEPQQVDICDYLNLNSGKFGTRRLYFDPTAYPPPGKDNMRPTTEENETEYTPWQDLKQDIGLAARDGGGGNPIRCNGGGGKNAKGDSRQRKHFYYCNHNFRDRKSRAMEVTDEMPLRSASLVGNDKRNRRENGKQLPRKTKQSDKKHKCPFMFTVKWDEYGFYVNLEQRAGTPEHEGHPKSFDPSAIPISTRLLTNEQKTDTSDVIGSTANRAVKAMLQQEFVNWNQFHTDLLMTIFQHRATTGSSANISACCKENTTARFDLMSALHREYPSFLENSSPHRLEQWRSGVDELAGEFMTILDDKIVKGGGVIKDEIDNILEEDWEPDNVEHEKTIYYIAGLVLRTIKSLSTQRAGELAQALCLLEKNASSKKEEAQAASLPIGKAVAKEAVKLYYPCQSFYEVILTIESVFAGLLKEENIALFGTLMISDIIVHYLSKVDLGLSRFMPGVDSR